MLKYTSKEIKLLAIKHYKKYGSLRKTCKIFNCSKSSLQRWIEKHNNPNKERKKSKRKVNNEIINFVKKIIDKRSNIILIQIQNKINNKFNIKLSLMTIFRIIKKINYSRKRLRKKYFPDKKIEIEKDLLKEYYKRLDTIKINKLISIDETSIYLNMSLSYGRSKKGKRAYLKTTKYPYVKYNMICGIKYGKIIGYEIYEKLKGGIKQEQFINFINKYINKKYKNHYILIDNASFHRSKNIYNTIMDTNNKLIFSVIYHPETNPIENLFSQFKHYIKLKNPQSYDEVIRISKLIFQNKITKEHLKNYFKFLYVKINNHLI